MECNFGVGTQNSVQFACQKQKRESCFFVGNIEMECNFNPEKCFLLSGTLKAFTESAP